MKSIPLVRKAPLATAISYLAGEGVPIRRHLSRAGLSGPSPDDLEALMPLHQLCDFLSSVARAEGIDDLGFRIGGRLGIESLGVYGRLIAQSVTIHEAILTSRALISSYNSGLEIWIERHSDQVRYCQKYSANLPRDGIAEIVHLGLANALAQGGARRGPDYQPTRIELAADPIDLGPYVPGFGDLAVSFSQPQTSVWFDQTWLSKPLPALEPSHCPPADDNERALFDRTGPSTDPIGQLKQVIESALGHPRMSLQHAAAIIGTSARTLQRRLAERGLSFSGLLGRVRFAVAQRLLRDPEMLLTEIARRLGYSDLPNFIRAFKRWTGVGPNEFRRLHYDDGQEWPLKGDTMPSPGGRRVVWPCFDGGPDVFSANSPKPVRG